MKIVRTADVGLRTAGVDPTKIQQTIVVAGNYRCGTTWLAEMIVSTLPCYALAFEPLRAYLGSIHDAGLVQWRPYLTAETATEAQRAVFTRVLDGTICRTDALPRTDRRAVLDAHGLVVKFVRVLMSLRWLCDTYPIRHAFIVIRHPLSAIASQVRKNAAPGTPQVYAELADFARHHPEIDVGGLVEPEEWLAMWWAASYYAALTTPKPHPWTLVRHEDLCADAGAIQSQVFDVLDATPDVDVDELRLRPSMTSGDWSIPGTITPWHGVLTAHQARRVLDVVARFGNVFDDFYEDLT